MIRLFAISFVRDSYRWAVPDIDVVTKLFPYPERIRSLLGVDAYVTDLCHSRSTADGAQRARLPSSAARTNCYFPLARPVLSGPRMMVNISEIARR